MSCTVTSQGVLHVEDTELRLGLPGTDGCDREAMSSARGSKRASEEGNSDAGLGDCQRASAPKAQVVGWPPIRSYRRNTIQAKKAEPEASGVYVKVSMDGAPYLRKIDLKAYKGYPDLLKALEYMFKFTIGEYSGREGYKGSEYVPTYEDKDGDWMLVGDVPWDMFASSCKRLRIIKASDAKGLGCSV
ncbi:Auxin-responsive protein iaa4 [Ancistrocladus abbreviatus]